VNVSVESITDSTFMLPDLGEGLTEAEVVEWHVAQGDEVHVDQIVVTVETAKASVDLPCPYAGRVGTLHGVVGAVLEVGKPLITVGHVASSGSGNVLVGYGTSETKRTHRRRVTPGGDTQSGSPTAARLATATLPEAIAAPAGARTPVAAATVAPKVISPVVRRLARDMGVDLTGLAPSGHSRVIRRADVEAALHSDFVTPSPGAVRADRGGDIRIPLRGVRKAIADKLTTSRREIPDVTTWVDVDATALMAAKDEIQAVNPEAGIGLLALLARITVAGLKRFPELNARVDVEAQEIVQLRDIHLSFAAQSPRGLMVPVVHGAGEMTTAELAAALRELTALARDGALSPAQMTGGTFTLNNYGVFGVDGSTPIINHPEAAMLGIGRIIDRPWAHEGQLALRKVAQLSFTFDHRVCDGGTAGGFLRFVADCVERPTSLLALL
jgi:2-oxoisovalerate dehydrogenase E2 component (dihydrolipoyl transacylase)